LEVKYAQGEGIEGVVGERRHAALQHGHDLFAQLRLLGHSLTLA
jgi:hypothetical protein